MARFASDARVRKLFNQPVENVEWPTGLQELRFGFYENFGNDRVAVYAKFNQCIGRSVCPASLRRLTLGHMFRQSLQGLGKWMPNLETLRLLDRQYDSGYDSLLRGIDWPKDLRELVVFEDSNRDGVEVPSTVQVLEVENGSLR